MRAEKRIEVLSSHSSSALDEVSEVARRLKEGYLVVRSNRFNIYDSMKNQIRFHPRKQERLMEPLNLNG